MKLKTRINRRKELKIWYNEKLGRSREAWQWYEDEWSKVQWIWEKIGTWLYYDIWVGILERYIIDNIRSIPKEIRWAYQRVVRGWSDRDTWSFSCTLAPQILGMLNHFQKVKSGYPATTDPKTGKSEFNEKRWDKVVDELIWTFGIATNITDGEIEYFPAAEFDDKEFLKAKKLVRTVDKERGKKTRILSRKESKRFEKGIHLFTLYFFALWD